MTLSLDTRARPRFWAALLAVFIVAFLAGCAKAPPKDAAEAQALLDRTERAGPKPKLDQPVAVLASFGSTGGDAFASDSIRTVATWTVPSQPDGASYGQVDSVVVLFIGGYPIGQKRFMVAPTVLTLTANLPLNMAGSGGASVASVDVRVCVTTYRKNVAGPDVCKDSNAITITFPAPTGVTGLTATATKTAFP